MSSLTAVKIRGKKQTDLKPTIDVGLNLSPKGKRPSSPISDSPTSAKRSRQATDVPISRLYIPSTRSLSPLENLPIELLETIFFYCLNVSLPQASLFLGRKLASHHVKSQLVYRVLSSPSSTEYPCAVAAAFPTLKEQAEAQSAILRLKWMTLPFLRNLIPDFIVKTLVRELTAGNIPWKGQVPVVSPAFESSIRQHVNENGSLTNHTGSEGLSKYWEISWQANPATFEGLSKHWGERWVQVDHDLWAPSTATSITIYIGIGLQDGVVTLGNPIRWSDEIMNAPVSVMYSKWRILCGVEGCMIPDKLLHGPWTDDKCEFLEIAMRGDASVDWLRTTSGEVANDGLLQALKERNARAVKALLQKVDLQESNYVQNDFPDLSPSPGGKASDLSSLYKDIPVRRGIGVIATTEHLRQAILEEGCQEDVVMALLQAPESTVDRNDAAINQWLWEAQWCGEAKYARLLRELQR